MDEIAHLALVLIAGGLTAVALVMAIIQGCQKQPGEEEEVD